MERLHRPRGQRNNADLWVLDLFKTFQNLADFPDIGTPRDYLPALALAFPHDNYIIAYRKRDDGHVDILNVVFGGMDLYRYFSERLH